MTIDIARSKPFSSGEVILQSIMLIDPWFCNLKRDNRLNFMSVAFPSKYLS